MNERMSHPGLTLTDLAHGLETFSDRYQALDVFFDDIDVSELQRLAMGEQVPGLYPIAQDAFLFDRGGHRYRFQIFADEGVARVTRHTGEAPSPATNAGTGALAGAAVGALLGAGVSSKRAASEGTATGLVLGLLVGAALGAASTSAEPPRRVFALCFDANEGQWRAYDGGLVRWMKSTLAPPEGARRASTLASLGQPRAQQRERPARHGPPGARPR